MVAAQFPRGEQQYQLYKSVMDAVPNCTVTFRTLDIGGDKILPYMSRLEEDNPALGWRAIRIGLDRPGLLRTQLRAMLRAGAGRDLRIMFPMVAVASEIDALKDLVARELAHLKRHNYETPRDLKLGIMIEVPSVLFALDEIMPRVDFVSVGSNDLTQYLFAADRDNKRVATRFDPLAPSMLRALKSITDKAAAHGTSVTLCGEMGGKPLDAMALIGIGYRNLSMSPASLGPVKAMLLALNASEISAFMSETLSQASGADSIRNDLRAFAEAKGVPL